MRKWKCDFLRRPGCGGCKSGAERAALQKYRCAAAGFVVLLIMAVGAMIAIENPQAVLQEKSVVASDIYSFSFVTQERGSGNDADSSGDNGRTVRDSAVAEIVDSDEVYYSDSFFTRSNNEYDHELARASLALSMTTFRKKHVMTFMGDLGFENLVSYRYDQTGDEDKVALVMGHKDSIIAVAIRGGKYGDEWGSNGRIGYDGESFGYHYGFHEAAKDAIVQLKEYAADNDLDLGDSVVWITGFSRGAAVANVMGAMLTGQAAGEYGVQASETDNSAGAGKDVLGSGNQVTISSENLFCYTFAPPSTVSESFVTAEHGGSVDIDENGANPGAGHNTSAGIYNVVNPLDIVTHLPMNAGGISKTSKGRTIRYNWDYTKYGTTLNLPAESESSQMQVVQLLENALAFATRSESRYVERTQEQVIIPALKKTMGKGADISKRNIGYVLVDSLPGVTTFVKNEIDQLDFRAQIYVAGILSGKKSIRLEKEHWPETYWGWMAKIDGLE